MPSELKKCERCGCIGAKKGYRFCSHCAGILMREMKRSGYLTTLPRGVDDRTRDEVDPGGRKRFNWSLFHLDEERITKRR